MSLASEDDDDGDLFPIIPPNLVMQNDLFEYSDVTKKQYQQYTWLIKIINTNSNSLDERNM